MCSSHLFWPCLQLCWYQEVPGPLLSTMGPMAPHNTGGSCAAIPGQHDSGVLHQQDGRDTVVAPMLGSHRTLGHGVVQRVAGASQSGGLQEGLMVSQGEGDTVPSTSVGMLGGEEDYSLLTDQAALLVDQDVRPATHKLYKNRFSIFSTY